MSVRSKLALTASAALVAAATLTASGNATASGPATSARAGATYVVLKGGATTLRLNPGTAKVLTDNGISVAPTAGEFLVTGKRWPLVYRVRFVRDE